MRGDFMKNSVTLLPADTYIVINKSLLNENDKVTLNMLYMPIIGNTAVTLYNILYNELKANNFISAELTHHHLMTNLNITLDKIKEARIKLEGVGLLKTFVKEGNLNNYVYELYSPLSVNEFFNHPVFNIVLFNNVGKEEYLRIKNYFKLPTVNLNGYVDITSPFDMTFKSKPYTNLELINEDELVKKEKNQLCYEEVFDFDALLSSMPKSLLNERALTKSSRELITNLAFLYNLDPLTMADIVKTSLNEKGLIDKELLKTNVRKYYGFNNEGRLPSLIFKSQPDYLRSPKGDNSLKGRIIKVFETTKPYDFLKSKYKGVRPTERDMKILEMLVVDLKLNPAVVNVLIDYILKIQNNRLVKNYVEVVASEWKRAGLETAKEAMEYAEKSHKKMKKIKETKNVSVKKEENTPDWFNKNLKKEELEVETKEVLEDFLKEFV